MNRPLRVGLAGCGDWGRNVLRDLLSLGCEVDVVDPAAEAGKRALAMGARSVVTTLDGLAAACDAWVIAAPTTLHGAIIDRLLPSQRPIFCEKPLTADAAHAERIAGAAGDRVFVMHKWRYHPGVEKLAELARSGEYGRVQQIVTRRLQRTGLHRDMDAISTLAPHDLSMVYGILGFLPEPRTAAGTAGPDGQAQSLFAVLGDAQPTAVIHVATNWPAVERIVSVTFEQAVAVLDDPLADHIKLYAGQGGGDCARLPVSTEFPLLRELRAFLDHVRGGEPPKTGAAEGALVVRTLERLRALAGL